MKYRFTAKDFLFSDNFGDGAELVAQASAERSNARLEQWERERERMKYRFTAGSFVCRCHAKQYNLESHKNTCDAVENARHANALLEQWEKESEKVYADCRPVHRNWGDEVEYPPIVRGKFTIEAILWNPRKIGEKGEGEGEGE